MAWKHDIVEGEGLGNGTPSKKCRITDYFTPTPKKHSHKTEFDYTSQYTTTGKNNKQDKVINLNIVTHNIQTLENSQRIQEIDRNSNKQNIHVLAIQGTCWDITNTWDAENYRVYHSGKPKGTQHKHEGVMIMMHKALTKNKTEHVYHIIAGRLLAVRLSDRHNDITVISAYIPTEESRSSEPVWKELRKFMRSLPMRTTVILTGDMNSHIDMSEQTRHWQAYEQTRNDGRKVTTNDNGTHMVRMMEESDMFISNTVPTGEKWTKQTPDGNSQSTIDFILIPVKHRGHIQQSMGPDYKNQLRLRKEGTTIDHIAVQMTIKIPYQWKKQPSRAMPRWDQHQLQKIEEEWEKNRLNQQVKKPVEVDQNLIEQAEQLREAIKQALHENCKEGMNIDELSQNIHESVNGPLEDIVPYQKKVTVKQKYIGPELWAQIEERQQKWSAILKLSTKTARKAKPIDVRTTFQALAMYVQWRKQKRRVQREVRQAKRDYMDKLLQDAELQDVTTDSRSKYNIINKLAPRMKGYQQAIKMQSGGYAHTTQQETQAYDDMVRTIWNGRRINDDGNMYDNIAVPRPPGHRKEAVTLPATTADVRAAFRKCKTHKAMCKQTRPAEILHVADDIIAPYELELWQGIAQSRRIPNSWAVSDIVLIPKPGKDPSDILNRRGINKIDSGLKAYSTYVQTQTSPFVQEDAEGEWGGLNHKSTRQPLLVTDIMIYRARKAKMDLALFAGDVHKAFDCADHGCLSQALPRFIDHPVWPCVIEDRHEFIVFRFTLTDGTEILYRIEQGAVQGCSLGPLAFGIYYRAFLRHLASMRTPYQNRIMQFRVDSSLLYKTADTIIASQEDQNIVAIYPEHASLKVSLNSLAFVDDHLEMWAVRNAKELRAIFKPFIQTQQEFHLQTNFKKTQMAIVPRGRQSVKRLKSFGGQFTLFKGESVKLQKQIKYLGSIIDVNGSNKPAVSERIRLARASHIRLTPGIFRSRTYTTTSKIQLMKTHENTVLLHGLDTRVLNKGEKDMLERHQMRSIRHISKSQAHISKESNKELRTRLGVPTIESQLQVRRLSFYRDVFERPYLNRQVIAALYGHTEWDPRPPNIRTLPHMKQLHQDITQLWQVVNETHDDQQQQEWSKYTVCPKMQKWLNEQTHQTIKKLLTFSYERETQRHQKRHQPNIQLGEEEGIACDVCHDVFSNIHAMSVHRWSKHRTMNPLRAQVVDDTCPGCKKQFTCKVNARSHWVKQICVRNGTATRTADDIQQAEHEHSPAGQRPASNIAQPAGSGQASGSGDNVLERSIAARAIETGARRPIARVLDDYFRIA